MFVLYTHIKPSSTVHWRGGNDIPIIISTSHAQIVASKQQFSLKCVKMADSRAGQGKYKISFEILCAQKKELNKMLTICQNTTEANLKELPLAKCRTIWVKTNNR